MKKANYGTIVLMIGLMMCVSCSQVSFNNPFGEAQPNAAGVADSDESSDKVDPQSAGKMPEHKIRYLNVKNADNSANPTSFKESEAVMLTKVSISDCTFDGWYEVTDNIADTSTDGWAAGAKTADVTLWAKWSAVNNDPTDPVMPAVKVYTIRFDNNGGSGAMSDITADVGTTITLPACTFNTPTGKKFGSWNGKADGTAGINYADSANVKNLSEEDGAVVTLYAQWIDKDAHRIVYHNTKNADNSSNPTSFKESEPVMLTDASISGWTFGGWYDSSADGTIVSGWSAGERTDDVSLWAKWTANEVTYTVKRYFQNASGDGYDASADIVKSGLTDAITDVTADEVTGFTPCTIVQQKISADGSTVVSVYYDRKVVVYTFNANGGKWDDESNVKKAVGLYGAEVGSPDNPSRAGYSFSNWDAEVPAIFGETAETWTAQWSERKYTVKFDANGGNGTMGDQSIFCDIPTVLTRNSFRKEHWAFDRWNTSPLGIGTDYIDESTVLDLTQDDAVITLYAQWNMCINGLSYPRTSFVRVMDDDVVIIGSDENWNEYMSEDADDYLKGVFVDNRTVRLSPFSIAQYLVTQQLFYAVMNYNPSYFTESKKALRETENNALLRPVENVNWYEAITFCNKLSILMERVPCYSVKVGENEIEWSVITYSDIPKVENADWNAATVNMSANGYRLPTEAEWEFAARGGDQTKPDWKYAFSGVQSMKLIYRNTNESDHDYGGTNNSFLYYDVNMETVGWYKGNRNDGTYQVGERLPNRLGVYDMSGNVYEWCWDWYNDTVTNNDIVYSDDGVVNNPLGALTGSEHVRRGACWNSSAEGCIISRRVGLGAALSGHYIGLRIVCNE